MFRILFVYIATNEINSCCHDLMINPLRSKRFMCILQDIVDSRPRQADMEEFAKHSLGIDEGKY